MSGPSKMNSIVSNPTARAVGNSGAARSAFREAVDSFQAVGAQHEIAEVEAELDSLPG